MAQIEMNSYEIVDYAMEVQKGAFAFSDNKLENENNVDWEGRMKRRETVLT